MLDFWSNNIRHERLLWLLSKIGVPLGWKRDKVNHWTSQNDAKTFLISLHTPASLVCLHYTPSSSSFAPWLFTLLTYFTAGASKARVQGVAVSGGGANTDGVYDVRRLEVWAGQRTCLPKAAARTALDCGLDWCWVDFLIPVSCSPFQNSVQ